MFVAILIVVTIWLYCRMRKRRASSTSRVKYGKLQKRDRSPASKEKHLSLVTTSSSRKSSISAASDTRYDPSAQEQTALQYDDQGDTEYRSPASNLHRNPSTTSQYSFRPEQGNPIPPAGPTLTVPRPLFSRPAVSSNLVSRPSIPERRASASNVHDLNRQPSTRVANYHTDSEYSDLIGEELTGLLGDETLPPPTIPRRSSRRDSQANSVDGVAAKAVIDEHVHELEGTSLSVGDSQGQTHGDRFRGHSWYAS